MALSKPLFNGIRQWFAKSTEYYKLQKDLEEMASYPVSKRLSVSPRLHPKIQSEGDIRFRNILKGLNICEPNRSAFQVQYHIAAILGCAPHIFGNDFESRRAYIMEYFRVKEINPLVLVVAPRRTGKTVGTAVIIACLLVYVPGIRIIIFSTGKRASQLMQQMVKVYVIKLGAARRIIKDGETFEVAASELAAGSSSMSSEAKEKRSDGSTSKLTALPANEYGNVCVS